MSLDNVRESKSSWLNFCKKETLNRTEGNLLEKTKVSYYGVFEEFKIEPQSDDIDYIIRRSDRVDLLADRFYGDHLLWWVIALKNQIDLPVVELIAGMKIVIPSPRYVREFIVGQRVR